MMESQYWTLIDTEHFELNMVTEPYTIALGIAIKPISFTGGKANNLCIFVDLVFFTFELEFRWKVNV